MLLAWMGTHPLLSLGLIVALLLVAAIARLDSIQQPSATASDTSPAPVVATATPPMTAPPKFRVFKFKTDEVTSYVVPTSTTDEELKSLLWFFRRKVRAGRFKDIGITGPTSKQWGQLGYQSGMLAFYRGTRCASEEYVSLQAAIHGNLGPCGYGEHEDASYQWGINADPEKDSGDIRNKDGQLVVVFNYKDNWKLPARPQD